MAPKPVEWVLVVFYGTAAHQATYGRKVRKGAYTKDFIQLSRKPDFVDAAARIFSVPSNETGSVPLTYRWLQGEAPGAFVFRSADRPHLKWETSLGAPPPWRMAVEPSEQTAETIPGDPSHVDFNAAENELSELTRRGAGQPYLVAIKLRDEPRVLHLRAYLDSPSLKYSWADLALVPRQVRELAAKTSRSSALAWSLFDSGGVAPSREVQEVLDELVQTANSVTLIGNLSDELSRELARYLKRPGYGLFFDPERNHDAWLKVDPFDVELSGSRVNLLRLVEEKMSSLIDSDSKAESLAVDPREVEDFLDQISSNSYGVPDSTSTVKTRGSAQRAFADAVKGNYGYRCAITGISTRDFLVAAHIVPWSEDQSIRLDPSNGICLSLIVDRALEKGFLYIDDDHIVRVDKNRVGLDRVLGMLLEQYDGKKMLVPEKAPPRTDYLRRRKLLNGN